MDFTSHADYVRQVSSEVASLLHSDGHEDIFASVFPNHSGSITSAFVVNRVKESSRSRFMTLMQERIERYMECEEEATKERIRVFREQQEALLAVKKTRVERVKDALSRLAGQLSNNETDAQVQHNQELVEGLLQESGEVQTVGKHEVTQGDMGNRVDMDSGRSDDGLFDLDDFDSDRVDGNSDEYQTDEDGSITDSGMEMKQPCNDDQQLLATSVPISMPAFSRVHHEEPDSDNELAEDFENIGASIKKLALSVQDHSDTLFGDLPRPRVNSDATKRWH